MAKKTNIKNSAPQYVLNNIVIKAPNRKSFDIGDWRTALKSADTGKVKTLYDLFDDILIDGILSDAVSKRIDAVTLSELTFLNEKNEQVDEITNLINTPEFETLLKTIMQSRFYGRSGCEITFDAERMYVDSIPAKHINLEKQCILLQDSDNDGIYYAEDQQLLVLGKPRDFGLLLKAAPYVIYKRGGFGDWAQWVELFGMPQRIGKYNIYDPESRKMLEDAMENAGSAPYLIVPKETEIETKDSGSGNGASYNEFRQACNEETLITILGQTMTTVQGENGARSLGEVHKAVEEGKNKSDLRYSQRILNRYITPLLEARGYSTQGGKFVFPKVAEALTVTEIVQLSDIIDIPKSYIHDRFGIPTPADGEEVARRQIAQPTFNMPDEEVKNADKNFFMRLWDFFVQAPQVGANNGKALIRLRDNATMSEKLATRIANGESGKFDAELFSFIATDFVNGVQTAFKRSMNHADVKFAYGLQDDAFITALEMNLFHFSAGKTLAEIQELNKAFRDSGNFQEFSKKAEQICGTFNKTWQKTEYETAVLTAESASNYHRLMGKTKLFPYWKYVTAGDEKVREEHKNLDGVILPANDPRWKKIFPPNGWKCRCRVVPLMKHEVTDIEINTMRAIVDEYLGTSEWKVNEAQGWDSNRGETAEVFSKNQHYIHKFPNKAASLLGDLYYNDYGLESFGKKATAATEKAPVFTGDPNEWRNSHQVIDDYKGRKVQLTEEVFKRHTTKKYEEARVPLVECIPDVLKNPDEVWINDYHKKFDNLNFIKFYEDKVINVVCEVKNGILYQVTTWFEIEQNANIKVKGRRSRKIDPRWRYRRGLLIKK